MLQSLLEYNFHYNKVYIHLLVKEKVHDERCLSLISHVLNAQYIWNTRISGELMPVKPWQVHEIDTLESMNERAFSESMRIIKELDPEFVFSYHNTKGEGFSNSIKDTMVHITNHGTYHRGQLAIQLKELGIQPPASDYIMYKRLNNV